MPLVPCKWWVKKTPTKNIEIVGTPFERNLACVLAQCRRSNMHDGGGMLVVPIFNTRCQFIKLTFAAWSLSGYQTKKSTASSLSSKPRTKSATLLPKKRYFWNTKRSIWMQNLSKYPRTTKVKNKD